MSSFQSLICIFALLTHSISTQPYIKCSQLHVSNDCHIRLCSSNRRKEFYSDLVITTSIPGDVCHITQLLEWQFSHLSKRKLEIIHNVYLIRCSCQLICKQKEPVISVHVYAGVPVSEMTEKEISIIKLNKKMFMLRLSRKLRAQKYSLQGTEIKFMSLIVEL